jgi:hypothetical protein
MAMNSSIKNSRLLITGTLLHHKHQLRDFFNRYVSDYNNRNRIFS